jgi:uncharacterized membrane protein YhaH (DUF805 family)
VKERLSTRGLILFTMTVLVMVVAGGAFVHKMFEFVLTIERGDVQGFGAVSIATYLLGMLPLLFLTLWAVLSGRLRDVERPKFRMLELDALIERGGEIAPEGRPRG